MLNLAWLLTGGFAKGYRTQILGPTTGGAFPRRYRALRPWCLTSAFPCKWAKSHVWVSAARCDGAGNFEVLVDDDGPGLTGPDRAKAVKRGQRLDETKPGSGLGLSIVADLAHLYKGRFELEPSPQGGLRARLNLPAA
ncbi:MAG TPA: ATP-binding protein [Methyloceanibacter sp.]|nr:ATP-binding protein [Methyloceanibacter sp.]